MSAPARAYFTTLDGGAALRQVVLDAIDRARLAASRGADAALEIMGVSFTGAGVAAARLAAARAAPSLRIRLLADWQQGGRHPAKQARRLTGAGNGAIEVRYTLDQPYYWDPDDGLVRWSYAASAGLFHHKSMLTVLDGAPSHLVAGSFNWTKKAMRMSENVIALDAGPSSAAALAAMRREFNSIWNDPSASLSPVDAEAWFAAVVARLESGAAPPAPPPFRRSGEEGVEVADAGDRRVEDGPVLLAFSAPRERCAPRSNAGHSLANASRQFAGLSASRGPVAPLTNANLAKAALQASAPGDVISIAAFALSRRAPEYNALLHAARRGVRFRVLLAPGRAASAGAYLNRRAADEGLDISVRIADRRMHQKYLIGHGTRTVVTGTANFTPDAHDRHYEARLCIRGCEDLSARFLSDFSTLWKSAREMEDQ